MDLCFKLDYYSPWSLDWPECLSFDATLTRHAKSIATPNFKALLMQWRNPLKWKATKTSKSCESKAFLHEFKWFINYPTRWSAARSHTLLPNNNLTYCQSTDWWHLDFLPSACDVPTRKSINWKQCSLLPLTIDKMKPHMGVGIQHIDKVSDTDN